MLLRSSKIGSWQWVSLARLFLLINNTARDGSTEEIVGWMMEAQRLNKVEAKKRKLQETIERESRKDARMDDAMDGLDGFLSSLGEAYTNIASEQHGKENEFGTVERCD